MGPKAGLGPRRHQQQQGKENSVRTTLDILDHDSRLVLGDSLSFSSAGGNIIVGTAGVSPLLKGVDTSPLQGLKEGFMLKVDKKGKLYIVGSDAHGTAYGIIELTRLLGVSLWEFWADVTPRPLDKLELPKGYMNVQSPSVEFRGIFINDEDWGLTRWDRKRMMDFQPRKLPVFEIVPRVSLDTPLLQDEPMVKVWNGSEYARGNGVPQDMLGYEGKAAAYPVGEKQEFDFSAPGNDSVRIRVCLLPSFPVGNGQIRLAVSLAGGKAEVISYGTHWHSTEWCENVLFNRSVKEVTFPSGGKVTHTLCLEALDPGVVVDQVLVLQ